MSFRWITAVIWNRQADEHSNVSRLWTAWSWRWTILRNVGDSLPVDTAWHTVWLESSATQMSEPQDRQQRVVHPAKKLVLSFRFLWPCIVSKVRRERKKTQQDATIRCLLSTSASTCFGHHYANLQEIKDRVLLHTVYCVGSAGCGR